MAFLDKSGDIILDADGGDIFIKDGGTQVGSISNAGSNNFSIASSISDASDKIARLISVALK